MKRLLSFLFFLVSLTALAVDDYWSPTILTDYSTAANWSLVLIPDVSTNAFFTNVGATTVTVSANQFCSNMSINKATGSLTMNITDGNKLMVTKNWTIANVAGQNSILLLTNTGNLVVTNGVTTIGSSGFGIVTQSLGYVFCTNATIGSLGSSIGNYVISGGTNQFMGAVTVANSANSTGSYAIAGGTLIITNAGIINTVIGNVGMGSMTITTGKFVSSSCFIGSGAAGMGIYSISAGSSHLDYGQFVVGNNANSTGSVMISGGYLEATNNSTIFAISGIGTVTQSQGSVLITNLVIGNSARSYGSYVLSGGTNMLLGPLTVASSANSTGFVNIAGGLIIATNGNLSLGNSGIGMITQSAGVYIEANETIGNGAQSFGQYTINGGTNQVNLAVTVGNAANSTGVVTVSSGKFFIGTALIIGNSGIGSMLISNGGLVTNTTANIGNGANGINASVIVTDSGSIWTNGLNINVGLSGNFASLIISNGGLAISQGGLIGTASVASSSNTVLVTGSGSMWTNTLFPVHSGYIGNNNNIIITNAGIISAIGGEISTLLGSTNNSIIVTGSGSAWRGDAQTFFVGQDGTQAHLKVLKGGFVMNSFGYLAGFADSDSNDAVVQDASSLWSNSASLNIGNGGKNNILTVSNGSKVYALGVYGGVLFTGTNNTITVSDPLTTLWSDAGIFLGSNALAFGQCTMLLQRGATIMSTSGGVQLGVSSGLTVSNGNNTIQGQLVTAAPATIVGSLILK